jgi:hypothetical protein
MCVYYAHAFFSGGITEHWTQRLTARMRVTVHTRGNNVFIYSISSDETYAYMLSAYYNDQFIVSLRVTKHDFILGRHQNGIGQGSARSYVPIRSLNRRATETPRPAPLSGRRKMEYTGDMLLRLADTELFDSVSRSEHVFA